MATGQDVAQIALRAAATHADNQKQLIIGPHVFNLTEVGYCTRFVRQCHEAALGLSPFGWAYARGNARECEDALLAAKLGVADLQPGDIVAMNRGTGTFGHIGIYTGGGYICENTSSTVRGPGTVKSRLSAVSGKVSGYYRAVAQPPVVARSPLCVVLPGSDHAVPMLLRSGESWVPARRFAEALHAQGLAVELEWRDEHLVDQGKVYVAATE